MQQITIYKIFTWFLLPFAVLFGLFALIMFFAGLSNPAILLPVFIMAGFCLYSITSLIFLTKGLQKNEPCRASLKDWIKVNGYVSVSMALMMLFNSVSLIFSKQANIKILAEQLLANPAMKTQGLTPALVIQLLLGMAYSMLILSVVLLIHLTIGFRLLKRYDALFIKN